MNNSHRVELVEFLNYHSSLCMFLQYHLEYQSLIFPQQLSNYNNWNYFQVVILKMSHLVWISKLDICK